VTTHYLVDENRDYSQVLVETDGTYTVNYSHGLDLISQSRDGQVSYYLTDGLGSTRALTDETGAVTDTYTYTAYGEMAYQSGSTLNSYLYAGEQRDQETGLYNLRARYYAPSVGRFTQMDTWAGISTNPITLNKYTYANADPANYTDPTGNFSMVQLGVSIGISVSLNLAGSYFDGGLTPDSFANSVLVGTVEGAAFYGAAMAVVKTGARLAAAARTAILTRQLQRIFSSTSSFGPLIPGFKHLAYNFHLQTKAGKFFISSGSGSSASNGVSGALKHLVGDMIAKSGGAITTELAEALVIQELKAAIEVASGAGIQYGKSMIVSTQGATWEMVFLAPQAAGQLPKLVHMLPK
jgi:RHS repeat-associated protein